MEMRQEMSPEMQIYLIASDVEEVKDIVKKLEGTVAKIHVSLVGEQDRPGIYEELRALAKHDHPEVAELRTEMRVYIARAGGAVVGAVFVLELILKVWK